MSERKSNTAHAIRKVWSMYHGRVNILFTRFPLESAFGGAEVQTIALMRGLRARGHTVSFLGSCPILLKLCGDARIARRELFIGDPPVTKWGAVSFLWRKSAMRRKLKETIASSLFPASQAIVMLSLSEKLLLTPYAQKIGTRVLWIEHDHIGRWLRKNPWLPRLRRLSQNVTTVAVSELTRDAYILLGWNPEDIVSIPNGVMEPKIRNPEPRYRERDGAQAEIRVGAPALRLGCIARLTHDKGVDVLIDAVRKLPDVCLAILGRGREEKHLKARVQNLHLEKRVSFSNFIDDIDDFYRAIDVLVLPVRSHDPFGLVVAEAMIRGIPAICTTECGIMRHIRHGEDAIVCEADSPGALAEAIVTLRDPSKRKAMGEHGKKTALEKFTHERMVESYEKLLKIQ